MSVNVTQYSFPIVSIGDDTVQLRIIFFHGFYNTGIVNYEAHDRNIMVKKYNTLSLDYDLDDAYLVPSTLNIELWDKDLELYEMFFGTSELAINTGKSAQIYLSINGNNEFVGNVIEQSLDYNYGERTLKFTAKPRVDYINKKMLYDTDGNILNPFGYSENYHYTLPKLLEDIYKLVDSNISFSGGSLLFNHDWIFRGQHQTNYAWIDNINITELALDADEIYRNNSYGLKTCGDVLRKLSNDFGAATGLLTSQKAFFKKLFSYNSSNLQTVKVLNYRPKYKFNLIDFVRIKTDFTSWKRNYDNGIFTQLEDRYIDRKVLHICDSTDNGFTNIMALRGSDAYWVWAAKDLKFGNVWYTSAGLLSKFWYDFRSDIRKLKIVEFEIVGLSFDYMKDFNFNGGMYQPIKMDKRISEGKTIVEALYLGELL